MATSSLKHILDAVKNDPLAFEFADDELKSNAEVVAELCKTVD